MTDRKFLKHLFAAHAGQLVHFVRRRIRRPADAQDISQEVFLRMLRLDDLSRIHDPQGYLFTVANNLRRERMYTEGVHPSWTRVGLDEAMESEPDLVIELAVEKDDDHAKRLQWLEKATQQLAERDRLLLAMRFREGLSYREMARRLGWTSQSAVGKALTRAIARCRKLMDEMGAT